MRVQNIFDIAIFDSGLLETAINTNKPHGLVKKDIPSAKPQKSEQAFVYQALNSLGLPTMHLLTT